MTFDSGEQEDLARRRLYFVLVVSLVIHALLLTMGRPWVQDMQEAPLELLASLRPLPAAISPAPPTPSAAPPVRPPAAIPRRAVPPARLQGAAKSIPLRESPPGAPVLLAPEPAAPAVNPAMTSAVPVAATPPSSEPAAPAAATPALPPAVTENGARAAESPASGLSADGLRRYRLSLATESRRFKRYPAQALAAGWAGTAEIRLAVGNDGRGTAELLRSSGHEVLDRAAQTMIEAGARHTPVPEALRGKAFSVVLPVVFDISGG